QLYLHPPLSLTAPTDASARERGRDGPYHPPGSPLSETSTKQSKDPGSYLPSSRGADSSSVNLCALNWPPGKGPRAGDGDASQGSRSKIEHNDNGASGDEIHVGKRYHPYGGGTTYNQDMDRGGDGLGPDFAWRGSRGNVAVGKWLHNNTALCQNSYCFTVWKSDKGNKSKVSIEYQGCWLSTDDTCNTQACESTLQTDTHFCCCKGHMCNTKFKDVFDPRKHVRQRAPPSTIMPVPETIGPIHDHTYKEKTMIVALVLLLSISLMIVIGYLACRLCLTSKRASPLSSSIGTRTDMENMEGGLGPSTPQFNMEDLKVLDLIVRGRYSEVRRGTLNGKDVAIKIYQHHHRQYFFNERSAFSLPFMEHENLVKFFGAAERTVETADGGHPMGLGLQGGDGDGGGGGGGGGGILVSQYLIVTELAPLGSLTGYLKHHTVSWSQLCHMCQGICAGLVHLHTDVTRGDLGLFKPAIAHRDVNTRNILVKPDLTCVLADLGFSVGIMGSKVICNGVAEIAEQCSLADVGTLRYMAPEVFDGAVNLRDCEASLKQIDMYALGLVMWELASRCVDLYQGTPVPEYQLPFQVEAGSHPLFEELQVLVVKYKTRPKFPDVWKDTHPAVRYLKETIQDCWDSDADARLSALCVQERIADMASLWVQGSNRKREVMPTLNSDLWPDSVRDPNRTSMPGVVSNGTSVLPEFVDVDDDLGRIPRHDVGARDRGRNSEEGIVADRSCPVSRISGGSRYSRTPAEEQRLDDLAVTAPLIGSNLRQMAVRDGDESSDDDRKRVAEWLQEQSMSESTMDTLLPLTPISDRNQNLMDCGFNESNFSNHPGASVNDNAVRAPVTVAVKANNITLAQMKGVISHPNQGRNPTVERNTHKRSDEELAVQGNQLMGTLDSRSSGGSETLGPLAKRKGSQDTHNAPEASRDNQGGGNASDANENAGELSSLVQHDLLNDSHSQNQQAVRNTPIPFLQNQVMRPKLANVNVGTNHSNRSSYGHPVRDTVVTANTGDRQGFSLSYPQCGTGTNSLSIAGGVKKEDGGADNKSLKNKLSKFIRPKDLGHKFSNLIFGGKKKNFDLKTNQCNSEGSEVCADTAFQLQGVRVGSSDDPSQGPCHYDNSGLERSPPGRNIGPEGGPPGGTIVSTVPMQVKLSNGAVVSSTCPSIPGPSAVTMTTQMVSNRRLPSTDLSQVGFDGAQFKSPTLFVNHHSNRGEEISSTATSARSRNDNRLSNNNDSLGSDLESLLLPMHDQNHNTHTPTLAVGFDPTYPSSSSATTSTELNCMYKPKINNSNVDEFTTQNVDGPSSSSPYIFSDPSSRKQQNHVNICPESPVVPHAPAVYSPPDTKGGNLIMYSTESGSVVGKPDSGPSLASQLAQQSATEKRPAQSDLASDGAASVKADTSSDPLLSVNISGDQQCMPQKSEGYKTAPAQISESCSMVGFPSDNGSSNSSETSDCREPALPRLGMSYSWHEDGIGKSSGNSHCRIRPKSLSLQGHNYYKKKKANLKPAPDNNTYNGHISGEVLGVDSTNMESWKNLTNGCASTNGRSKDVTVDDSSMTDLGAQPLVAPNITLDSSIYRSDFSKCPNRKQLPPPAPSVMLLNCKTTKADSVSCPPLKHDSGNFRPIKSPADFPYSNKKTSMFSLTDQDNVKASGDTNSTERFESGSNMEHQKLISEDASCDAAKGKREMSEQGDVKLRRAGSASSDSSEKIRRRIKTPVSFKNGRLSLYDDRLMSQSFDSAVLYSMAGEEV
ncbi:hypothetical protein EGW08_008470, partial [Elysia chlorotica]